MAEDLQQRIVSAQLRAHLAATTVSAAQFSDGMQELGAVLRGATTSWRAMAEVSKAKPGGPIWPARKRGR